jgi:hypothetical protein
MSCWKHGIARTKRSLTNLREWLKQPSQAQIMCFQIVEAQNDQTRILVETVQALAEAQTRQAEAFQRQLQTLIDVWNQPAVERTEPLRSHREQELLRDVTSAARSGDQMAADILKPENAAQLEEYLSLFRES